MEKALGKLDPRAPGLYSHACSISTEAKFWLTVDGLSQSLRLPNAVQGDRRLWGRDWRRPYWSDHLLSCANRPAYVKWQTFVVFLRVINMQ